MAKRIYKKSRMREWKAYDIRQLRQHCGLTQDEFARELEVRQATISHWEEGDYNPRPTMWLLLNDLAQRAGYPFHDEPTEPASQ